MLFKLNLIIINQNDFLSNLIKLFINYYFILIILQHLPVSPIISYFIFILRILNIFNLLFCRYDKGNEFLKMLRKKIKICPNHIRFLLM